MSDKGYALLYLQQDNHSISRINKVISPEADYSATSHSTNNLLQD